ncbi:hypothetical protein P7C71_g1590, partial [Lecanoromycetidae sp. Uapishka_2]
MPILCGAATNVSTDDVMEKLIVLLGQSDDEFLKNLPVIRVHRSVNEDRAFIRKHQTPQEHDNSTADENDIDVQLLLFLRAQRAARNERGFKHENRSLQAHALNKAYKALDQGLTLRASYDNSSDQPAKLYHGDECLTVEIVDTAQDDDKPMVDMFEELRNFDAKLANAETPHYK